MNPSLPSKKLSRTRVEAALAVDSVVPRTAVDRVVETVAGIEVSSASLPIRNSVLSGLDCPTTPAVKISVERSRSVPYQSSYHGRAFRRAHDTLETETGGNADTADHDRRRKVSLGHSVRREDHGEPNLGRVGPTIWKAWLGDLDSNQG